MKKNEGKFLKALKDIFIGAKIEGKGGYVNLMKIKNKFYTEKMEGELIRYINDRFDSDSSFREEMFGKLYSFFYRYFNETGSIYFQYTPLKENIYEKIYTNKEDTTLFYKTHMLYYVKSERIFQSIDIKVEDVNKNFDFFFNFDVSQIELAKNNEKKEVMFEFSEIKDNKIVLNVIYSTGGKKTKTDEILKHCKSLGLTEDILEKALSIYKKQSEVDYFINKNANQFLKEQFNIYFYQYIFGEELDGNYDNHTQFNETRIEKLQKMKQVAYKIIDILSQFEDELVKIWNKPKFVRKSNYVLTLDKLENNIELIKKIINHKNFDKQLEEWKELGFDLDGFDKSNVIKDGKLNDEYKFLTIDTKHFDDLKYYILGNFDNLDEQLNGTIVNSDNYQALNTLMNKYRGKVKCIYIDPPYNTGSDGFIYKDDIQHSTWLSMMENRLRLAKEFLSDDGVIFVSIDDDEQDNLKKILDIVFGMHNFVSNIIWEKKYSPANDSKWLSDNHDFIICFAKNKSIWRPNLLERTEDMNKRYKNIDNDERGPWKPGCFSVKTYSSSYDYPIETPSGSIVYPPKGSCWQTSSENFRKLLEDKRIYFGRNNDSKPQIKQFLSEVQQGTVSKSIWKYDEVGHNQISMKEIENLYGDKIFDTPKPIKLISRIIKIGANDNSIILDFFSGSGTTQHSVIELNKQDGGNRKYLGIEMGEHFDNVILPRLKKVSYSSNWKEGKAQDNEGYSQIFKYYSLEQYEECLNKVVYSEDYIKNGNLFENNKDVFNQYIFLKDKKLTDCLKVDDKNKTVKVDLDSLYDDIDIAETLSNLLGKDIKKLEEKRVEFTDGLVLDLDNLNYNLIKPLIWWK